MPRKPNVNRLFADRDLPGLMSALRYPGDPTIRAQAARSLGEIGSLRAVESLLRSHFQDPEMAVRSAARTALNQVLGTGAETAITAYSPPDEEWIDESLPLEAELEETRVEWNESDIQGLIAIVRVDHDRQKRIKALQALSMIENTRAIDALASIATWSEEGWLKRAAREALADVYGENLDEVLQSYRQSASGEMLMDEDSDEDDNEDYDDEDYEDEDRDGEDDDAEQAEADEVDQDEALNFDPEDDDRDDEADVDDDFDPSFAETSSNAAVNRQTRPAQPVIQEEKPGLLAYGLLGLLFLVVVAGLIYFLVR